MKYIWENITALLLISTINLSAGSSGDRTQFFQNCRANCERNNCTTDGYNIRQKAVNYYKQTIFDKIFGWTCIDECEQSCMWQTVDAFLDKGWPVPQFYGKWPFLRFLGIQEPASAFFSIINFIFHLQSLRKFRAEVRSDSPCYYLWHFFSFVCLNGWTWSTIFHARDFPITELLDYAFAYSMVLINAYCLVYRMIYKKSFFLRSFITLLFVSFYANYFAYLSIGKFSYSLNMKINIATGILSGLGWLTWYYIVRKQRHYAARLVRFYVLFSIALCLELFDFPPIFWTIDAHSLWHLATAPLIQIFYSFIINDTKALRKEHLLENENLNKKI